MAPKITILLTTFRGLDLPPTVSIPVDADVPISALHNHLPANITRIQSRLVLSTTSNKQLLSTSDAPISSLLSQPDDAFLPLRLSVPLCGGKGGFGSQLRAAGGRMSTRKKRRDGEQHSSSRNLDGRRLRTVNEAKALAEYLVVKPEMDRKEREERRKRWESVVEMAEKREEEIRTGGAKARLDGKWVEAKEEAAERTREAVLASLSKGEIRDVLGLKESDSSGGGSDLSEGSESEGDVESVVGPGIVKAESSKAKNQDAQAPRSFFWWDEEEDEDMSEDSEDVEDDDDEETKDAGSMTQDRGKGKGKA